MRDGLKVALLILEPAVDVFVWVDRLDSDGSRIEDEWE